MAKAGGRGRAGRLEGVGGGRSRTRSGEPRSRLDVRNLAEPDFAAASLRSPFPIGGFAYSDGLEAATASGAVATASDLRAWMDVCLDETLGRMEGPAVWQAWAAFRDGDWDALVDARRGAHGAPAVGERQALEPRDGAAAADDVAGAPSGSAHRARCCMRVSDGSARRCRSRSPARARAPASTGGAPSRLRLHAARGDRLGGDAADADRPERRARAARAHARARAGGRRRRRQPRRAHRIVRAGGGYRGDDAAVRALEVVSS